MPHAGLNRTGATPQSNTHAPRPVPFILYVILVLESYCGKLELLDAKRVFERKAAKTQHHP